MNSAPASTEPDTEPAAKPLDFVWPLSDAQRALLADYGVQPWMIHPDTNPGWRENPHMNAVAHLGNREAFSAMDRISARMTQDIVHDKADGLAAMLRSVPVTESHVVTGYALFEFNHHRLALWCAQDFVRFVNHAKDTLHLKEDPLV